MLSIDVYDQNSPAQAGLFAVSRRAPELESYIDILRDKAVRAFPLLMESEAGLYDF
jgi:hypothetical protein